MQNKPIFNTIKESAERSDFDWTDKYRIVSVLKERKDTKVCVAEHIRLKQLRIIKTVAGASEETNAVLREAYLMKQLKHPCIPEIYDIEEHENGFSIIEEYIQGESLTSYCLSENPEKEKIIMFAIQLCSLLEYLHGQELEILHLDLKPDNILVKNDNLYLLDFGSAIQGSRDQKSRKLTGTPGYAAPECYCGEAGVRSDLYSVGRLLEFMLAHSRELCESGKKRSDKKLLRIMKKALRERPSDRYPSASAMRYALETIQRKKVYCAGGSGRRKVYTVGLAASGRRMGVTAFALWFAGFLMKQGYKVLYLECNESDAVLQMLSARKVTDRKDGIPYYRGIAVEEARSSSQAKGSGEGYSLSCEEKYYMEQGFQIILEDFGALTPENREEFLKTELSLYFAGCKEWELENTWKGLCLLQQKGSFLMLLNFTAEREFRKFAKRFPLIPCRRIPVAAVPADGQMHGMAEELLEELLEMLREGDG